MIEQVFLVLQELDQINEKNKTSPLHMNVWCH